MYVRRIKKGGVVAIGDEITVKLLDAKPGEAELAFQAPANLRIQEKPKEPHPKEDP